MLIDRESLPQHRPWIIFALLVTVLAAIWFGFEACSAGGRPSGSSPSGLTFGIAGGLIIIFEFLLWPRKWARSSRLFGRAQVWLRAHIWLGLLCLPLAVFHSGFRLGGWLATILMIIFLIVILSGVFGLVLQQYVPTRMLEDVSAETIYSQIGYVLEQLRGDADQLVSAVTGERVVPVEGEHVSVAAGREDGPFVVGSMGRAGGTQGKMLQTITPGSAVIGSEVLHQFYVDAIRPFLKDKVDPATPLLTEVRARGMFDDLRSRLNPAAHSAVLALEQLCTQRRQLLRQAQLHVWLHSWLWVHLPLSAALVVLLGIHVWVAVWYW